MVGELNLYRGLKLFMKITDYGYWIAQIQIGSSKKIGWYDKIPLFNEVGSYWFNIYYDGDYISKVAVDSRDTYFLVTTPGTLGTGIFSFLEGSDFKILTNLDDLCFQLLKEKVLNANYDRGA